MKRLRTLLTGSLVVAVSSPVIADVIVVNSIGPGDFTAIQPAVDAAVDGDTIYVKRGNVNYAGFTIDGKALTIVGQDNPNWPEVTAPVVIQNIPAGKTLTMSSMRFNSTPIAGIACLRVTSSAGAVRVCRSAFFANGETTRGAWIEASANVAFSACAVFSTTHSDCGGATLLGPAGLELTSSNIAMYECSLLGGAGAAHESESAPGGPGLLAQPGSIAFSSASVIQGGRGGTATCPSQITIPGDGGTGIQLNGPVVVQLLDSLLLGGFPGVPPRGGASFGSLFESSNDADPFFYVVPSLKLRVPSIAEEGETFQIEFTGEPGDHVYLNDRLSTTQSFDLVPSWRGVVVSPFEPDDPSGSKRARRWGVIPASGQLKQIYRAPLLAPGVEAQTRFLQAYRIGASGLTLGTFTTLTVLDSSF